MVSKPLFSLSLRLCVGKLGVIILVTNQKWAATDAHCSTCPPPQAALCLCLLLVLSMASRGSPHLGVRPHPLSLLKDCSSDSPVFPTSPICPSLLDYSHIHKNTMISSILKPPSLESTVPLAAAHVHSSTLQQNSLEESSLLIVSYGSMNLYKMKVPMEGPPRFKKNTTSSPEIQSPSPSLTPLYTLR